MPVHLPGHCNGSLSSLPIQKSAPPLARFLVYCMLTRIHHVAKHRAVHESMQIHANKVALFAPVLCQCTYQTTAMEVRPFFNNKSAPALPRFLLTNLVQQKHESCNPVFCFCFQIKKTNILQISFFLLCQGRTNQRFKPNPNLQVSLGGQIGQGAIA